MLFDWYNHFLHNDKLFLLLYFQYICSFCPYFHLTEANSSSSETSLMVAFINSGTDFLSHRSFYDNYCCFSIISSVIINSWYTISLFFHLYLPPKVPLLCVLMTSSLPITICLIKYVDVSVTPAVQRASYSSDQPEGHSCLCFGFPGVRSWSLV